MLTTPRAILFGLGLIAVAIAVQPLMRIAFITPAHALSSVWDMYGTDAVRSIATAIQGISACRN